MVIEKIFTRLERKIFYPRKDFVPFDYFSENFIPREKKKFSTAASSSSQSPKIFHPPPPSSFLFIHLFFLGSLCFDDISLPLFTLKNLPLPGFLPPRAIIYGCLFATYSPRPGIFASKILSHFRNLLGDSFFFLLPLCGFLFYSQTLRLFAFSIRSCFLL